MQNINKNNYFLCNGIGTASIAGASQLNYSRGPHRLQAKCFACNLYWETSISFRKRFIKFWIGREFQARMNVLLSKTSNSNLFMARFMSDMIPHHPMIDGHLDVKI